MDAERPVREEIPLYETEISWGRAGRRPAWRRALTRTPPDHRKPTAKARPAAHSSAPAARLKRAAPGAVFSRSTYTARMTIHGMFMTPVANSIVINAQQQPRQWRPFRTPARTAPNRVDSTPCIDAVMTGTTDGSIIAAIMTAHMRNTRARSARPQPVMRGISHMLMPRSMWCMPQASVPRYTHAAAMTTDVRAIVALRRLVVLVVMADPRLRERQTRLIAALRGQIEVVIGAIHHVHAAAVT